MQIDLRFFATFREAVGQRDLEWETSDDSTVGDVLLALETEFKGLDGELLEDGQVREQLNVLKNGRNVIHMAGSETDLEADDLLSVFPPVAGGGHPPHD